MRNFFNKVLKYGFVAFATYTGFRIYSIVKAIARISKTLPEFLKNIYGETPKFSLDYHIISNLKIKIGFSKNIFEDNNDIAETVKEYIQDFYPSLSKCHIDIDIYEKNVDEKNDEKEEETDKNLEKEVNDEEINNENINNNPEDDKDSSEKDEIIEESTDSSE